MEDSTEPITDNECYLIAKQELYPYKEVGDMTIHQLSKIIQLAQRIKERCEIAAQNHNRADRGE